MQERTIPVSYTIIVSIWYAWGEIANKFNEGKK